MKRFISLIVLSFVLSAVEGQRGAPLLTHFAESRNIENQSWAICQDENGIMLFANRKGIIIFDGQDWATVRIQTIPYAMQKNPDNGKIFIGGDNSYGYLEKDPKGIYKYIALSQDSSSTGIITNIIFNDQDVWFYSDQSITRFNLQTGKSDLRLDSKSEFPFTGMFITPENTFINVFGKGLFRLESDTLFPIVTGYLTENTDVLFSLPYNNDLVLVGLGDGTLSVFDGIKYYDFKINDEGYLKENILSEGVALGDSAYVFSTLEGGAIVIEKLTGKVLYTINNQNGLPDDEIFAVGSDNSGGLWLSHQYGLTRADLNLPVENYGIFPGLKGNLSSVVKHKGELYVATSEGVFYLTEVKNYADVQVLIKNEQSVSSSSGTPASEPEQIQQSGRKGIFNRIFGKKTVAKKPSEGAGNVSVTPAIAPDQYTRRTISKLKSINFIYKKVDGLNEKCRQLVSTPYGILAATNRGLYNIEKHKVTPVSANRYINFITWTRFGEKYYIGANDGYFSVKFTGGKWSSEIPDPDFYNPVYTITQVDDKTLWLGGDDAALRVDMEGETKYYSYNLKNEFPERYYLDKINDTIFLFTESGINYFNKVTDKFNPYKPDILTVAENTKYFLPLSNGRLLRKNNEWISLGSEQGIEVRELSLLKIFDDVVTVTLDDKNLWVIDGNSRLYSIDRLRSGTIKPSINILIKAISNARGIKFDLSDVKFERGDNLINFSIVSPVYIKQNTTQYQYFINNIMSDWSPWSIKTNYDKAITKAGDYVLQVRAKDLWGNVGEPQSVRFTIRAPFTKTLLFYIVSAVLILLLIILVVRFRERQLHNKNRLLEEKVMERTAEIEAQKEEITSSIEYASRIQMAMLPIESLFKEAFSDYFVMFKPRDIVSGDFYWIGEDDKSIFFTVADCTGHGVPGAFMSTMGISTLNEIIANNHNLQANTVLNLLRKKTKNALHQTGKEGEAADGMDVAFCVLNKNRSTLQFSGAYNPLFIFQGGELKEYKADRMPIGIHYGEEISFTNFVLKVSRGDTLYIFSDGFIDQFGGKDRSKYKKSNLKKLLSEIYYRPMVEQRNILEKELIQWMNGCDQIDDITILGIRI